MIPKTNQTLIRKPQTGNQTLLGLLLLAAACLRAIIWLLLKGM